MQASKLTRYAPDVYNSLNGILLIHKPPNITHKDLLSEFRGRITSSLNELEQRPISNRLVFPNRGDGPPIEVPNLADHPLVAGPRYLPWELSLLPIQPILPYRTSGLVVFAMGRSAKFFTGYKKTSLLNVYQITGKFGYITHNNLEGGRILDRANFKNINADRIDRVLSRVESSQKTRLFETTHVPLQSQEAYELAKAWPTRPPTMAPWPIIYRIRCIHLDLPVFKIEVSVINENESFLAGICYDIGLLLKSAAFVTSIKRTRLGPFRIEDSLIDRDWDLQSVINNLTIHHGKFKQIHEIFRRFKNPVQIKVNPARSSETTP